jgi:hypothetical protein
MEKAPISRRVLLSLCQDANCLLCPNDYSVCTSCNTGSQWYLNGNSCQSPTVSPLIPNFYGANTALGTVVGCQDSHCSNCKATYLTCIACDTANGWYLNGNVCQNAATFPVGMGPNLVTGLVETCSVANCNICAATKLACQRCDESLNYFLNSTSQTCVLDSNIPDTYGPNLTTGIIESCVDSWCLKCNFNNSDCTACKPGTGYFFSKDSASMHRTSRQAMASTTRTRPLRSAQQALVVSIAR